LHCAYFTFYATKLKKSFRIGKANAQRPQKHRSNEKFWTEILPPPNFRCYLKGESGLVQNYYEILGLSQGATTEEIRAAYLQLARAHHPDLHPEDVVGATQRFQAINEAYTNLHDPQERERFDRRWSHFQQAPSPTIVVNVVRWEGPGAKYRKARGGRRRYFSRPGGFFGMR
jgi:hypothetical protein